MVIIGWMIVYLSWVAPVGVHEVDTSEPHEGDGFAIWRPARCAVINETIRKRALVRTVGVHHKNLPLGI